MTTLTRTTPTAQQKLAVVNALLTRSALMSQLGQSYGGKRDLYETLGYPKSLTFEMLLARYTRQDIAKRLVNAFPDVCWAKPPAIAEIVETEEETPFEKGWKALLRKTPIWSYMKRVDRISGIGRFGTLLMGFDDGQPIEKPVSEAKKLLYLRPFNEVQSQILEWETDSSNERYGLPKMYNLMIAQPPVIQGEQMAGKLVKAHWSRVLHVADELTDNDVMGTPRLESVFNRLQDLELIAGGGAEMWWRAAFPGLGFKAVEGAAFNDEDIPQLENEIENYVHGLKRYLKLKNIDIQQLNPQLADVMQPFEVEITLISIATGIPKRILMGTERGELASSQDESAWDDRVEERRENYCAPLMLRPFIDRLVAVGILPEPAEGYNITWSPIHIMNEKDRATIADLKTKAIVAYAGTPGTEAIMAPEIFLADILGYDDDDITRIMSLNDKAIVDEQQRMKDEATMMAKVAAENAPPAPVAKAGGNGGGPKV